MNHASLDLPPEAAAALMEAALAVGEPLPPGPLLDEAVAKVLRVDPRRDWLDEEAAKLPAYPAAPMSMLPDFEASDMKVTELGRLWFCEGCGRERGQGDNAIRLDMGSTYVCELCYVTHRGEIYKPYSTDAEASDEARRVAFEKFEMWFLVSPEPGFSPVRYMAINMEGGFSRRDNLTGEGKILAEGPFFIGETVAHAVALALVAAGRT